MTHIVIVLVLAAILVLLVQRGLIQVDVSFPWFVGIVVLGLLSTNAGFVEWVAAQLGILYPPIAIILLALFFVLGLITVLFIALTRLRQRQIQIVRYLAAAELRRQVELAGVKRNGER